MKITFYLAIISLVFVQNYFGQSVKIVPKKVYYVRPKIDALNDPFGMKRFVVNYPKISGKKDRKIEALLSYEKAFDFKINDELSAERGVRELNFKVINNSGNILSVELTVDAFTFSDLHYNKFLSIEIKNSKILEPADVFKNLQGLASMCRKSQLKAITEVKKLHNPEDYGTIYDDVDFTTAELSGFTVGKKGVTFHDPLRFARTAIIFEPDKDYFFSWKKLKPFIKRASLLARFIR